jgi:hypothetical protein
LAWIPGLASAQTVYPGNDAYSGNNNQVGAITQVVMNNDATNLYVTIDLDPAADLVANQWVNYEIGFQDNGPGSGSTSLYNPWGEAMGISTGMYDLVAAGVWGGSALDTWTDSFHYTGSNTLTQQYPAGLAASATNTSISVTVPLASLGASGLVNGSSFNFDVWTTSGASPTAAIDALDNNNTSPVPYEMWGGNPWSNSGYDSLGSPYDSATDPDSTFATTIYTVVIPEPASLSLFCLSGFALMLRRRGAK